MDARVTRETLAALNGARPYVVCEVARCREPADKGGHTCMAHTARVRRHGSPTARYCYACRAVVDDTASGEMRGQGAWKCNACLVRPIQVRKPAKWHKAAFDLTEAQVRWLGSRCVATGERPSEFLRGLLDRLIREENEMERGERERLPATRRNVTYKLRVGGHGLYVTLGLYPDGRVGEVFIDLSKEGSPLRTAFQTWAIGISKALQHGENVREVTGTFRGTRVEPSGHVVCPDVPALHGKKAVSIYDAVARLIDAETDEKGVLRE